MLTIGKALQCLEDALDVYGRAIYTKIGIKQTTYSAWKTGKNKTFKIDLQGKLATVFGVDFGATQRTGEIVIVDKALFLKHCKKRPLPPLSSFENHPAQHVA